MAKPVLFRLLSQTGDDVLKWDPTNPEEVETARKSYNEMIEKGYEAFTVGKAPKKLASFDEALAEFQPGVEVTFKPKPKGGCNLTPPSSRAYAKQ